MNYIDFMEKIQIFMDLITTSQLLMGTIVLISLAILLFISKQVNKKRLFSIVLLINIGAFLVLILSYKTQLVNMWTEVVNKIFLNIYFPSIELYIFILLFMFIVFIVSVLKFNMKKSYKITNIITFFTVLYLFLMFLYVVSFNEINIFEMTSVYTNKDVVTILELTIIVCILWGLITVINSISNVICNYVALKKRPVDNRSLDTVIDELRNEAFVTEPIPVNNNFGVCYYNEDIKDKNVVEDYTLEQYKTFNNILKQIILLNSYKSKIELSDLLNENILSVFSKEDRELYKSILNYCLK